jgi:AcrR family transcriptional regulator
VAKRQPFTRIEPDARKKSLLAATARCLAVRGAAGVSVRAICAEAGVSPGLLTHYFRGVSEAIAETYRWTGARVSAALEQAVAEAGPDPRAPADRLPHRELPPADRRPRAARHLARVLEPDAQRPGDRRGATPRSTPSSVTESSG